MPHGGTDGNQTIPFRRIEAHAMHKKISYWMTVVPSIQASDGYDVYLVLRQHLLPTCSIQSIPKTPV